MSNIKKIDRTGFYIFDDAELSAIPDFARNEFINIYNWFKENHVQTVWNTQSLEHAENVIYCAVNDDPITEDFFSKEEIQALEILNHIEDYELLNQEAIKEYCRNGGDLYPKGFLAKQRRRLSVFMDFLLRNPIKIQAMTKINKLREEVQERIGFEHGEWVGF